MSSLAEERARYRERLERAIEELPGKLAALGGVERAILFGSYLDGRRDLLTDLDIVVILDTEEPFPARCASLAAALRLGVDADIMAYTPGEWERLRERPFFARAERYGRTIYERDTRGRSDPLAPSGEGGSSMGGPSR